VARDRSIFVIFGLFVAVLWAEYAAYIVFADWGFQRFLLPSWPLLMLAVASTLLALGRARWPPGKWIAAFIVVGLGIWNVRFADRHGAFDQRQADRHAAVLGTFVRTHTEPNSVVITMQFAGSLRYYAGRTTIRYDAMSAAWLDRAVDWMKDRGIHTYALLDEREIAEFQQKYAGQHTLTRLERPLLVYLPAATSLFDLTNADAQVQQTFISRVAPKEPGCDPPGDAPMLVLR
jgi:hypothetical protein